MPATKFDYLKGLSQNEAEKRLESFGPNQISKIQEINFWAIAKEEVTEPMILLLLVVGFFYSIWGKLEDALTILVVILILVFVEVWNEYRAKKAISALSKMAAPKTKVLRESKIIEMETEKIVPGDILILTTGTRIAADAKILESYSLETDESALTGESLPREIKVNEQIYAGTLIVAGEGRAKVIVTGRETKFGKIAALSEVIKEPKTPLQLAMKSLAKNLVWLSLFFSIIIPLFGWLRGQDLKQMILTGLSLAFAIIPEELPIIITMVLGLGAYQLSKKNFLIKKIKAAENLGNTSVILTDKTGTITENKMKVVSVFPTENAKQIIESAFFALTEISLTPTDKAIIAKAKDLKLTKIKGQILREHSFDNTRKTKSVLRKINNQLNLLVIGAPEEIFKICQDDKNEFAKILQAEAQKGRRVIAIAQKEISSQEQNLPFVKLEQKLNLVGLISLEDPPRQGVKETIAQVKQAGIRTIMVTGDHPQTAAFIAKSVGIPSENILIGSDIDKLSDAKLQSKIKEVSIFARTSPEHKYRLVKALQTNGEIVAVTGDGVNDSLALKGADIGIAMGIKGTDAAKEAADIVLADDNYITLTSGIFEGRKFFDNLSKGVKYYLSVKIALIMIFFLPILLNIPFPFSPIQIIVLELFMDLAASAGFVAEPAEKNIYLRPPRKPKEKFLAWPKLLDVFFSGFSLFLTVSLIYLYSRCKNIPQIQAQTLAFSAWLIGHIILAFFSRSEREPLYSLKPFSNKLMNLWAGIVFAFLILLMLSPSLASYFKLTNLTFKQFLLILIISFVIIFWKEFKKIILYKLV
jgi:Ca2+-transporting ATPase